MQTNSDSISVEPTKSNAEPLTNSIYNKSNSVHSSRAQSFDLLHIYFFVVRKKKLPLNTSHTHAKCVQTPDFRFPIKYARINKIAERYAIFGTRRNDIHISFRFFSNYSKPIPKREVSSDFINSLKRLCRCNSLFALHFQKCN